MAIYLRQICTVAESLAHAVEEIGAVFATPVCHVDPGVGKFGLENALMAIGSQFLEVVAPLREGTAAGRYLDRRGGNGGYMVICQVRDRAEQDAVRTRAAENAVRVSYESDRGSWNIMQLHPGDMRATFFEVDWDENGDETGVWQPAGGLDWRENLNTELVSAITAAELQSDDPAALAAHWARVAGAPVEDRGGIPHVPLGNADLRFVANADGRGAGLGAIDLRAADPARVLANAEARGCRTGDSQLLVCGLRVNLVS
ncbi:MAG: hypothetical protein CL583_04740 [Alteromonadaceae bacterium]|nr:hypothetical protein [Alteromonadaceae bacterium]